MRTEALKKAQRKYYEKIKHTPAYRLKVKLYQVNLKEKYNTDEVYRNKKREYQKKYYYNKKILLYNNNEDNTINDK